MGDIYRVERVMPTVYIDIAGKPVNGYLVYIYLVQFDELHELRLPDIKEVTVKRAADKLVEERRKLSEL